MTSSSPTITDREFTDGVLVLAVAASTFVGYASSVLWSRVVAARVFRRRELALERQVAQLEAEAETVCTTSQLYEHSRLMRQALRLRQELQAERRKRYSYECSLDRVFSPLTIGVSFRPGFGQSVRGPAAVAAAARIAERAIEANRMGGAGVAPAKAAEPPAGGRSEVGLSASPASRLRACVAEAANMLRYNAAAMVKYSLRYGTLVVFLCACGNRRALMTAPPSFEEDLHQYTVQVLMPLLFDLAMYGPAAFGEQSRLPSYAAAGRHADQRHGADAAAGSATAANSLAHASSALLDGGTTSGVTDASLSEVQLRLCASNDLISWFLTCLLASYLIVRVVRTA